MAALTPSEESSSPVRTTDRSPMSPLFGTPDRSYAMSPPPTPTELTPTSPNIDTRHEPSAIGVSTEIRPSSLVNIWRNQPVAQTTPFLELENPSKQLQDLRATEAFKESQRVKEEWEATSAKNRAAALAALAEKEAVVAAKPKMSSEQLDKMAKERKKRVGGRKSKRTSRKSKKNRKKSRRK